MTLWFAFVKVFEGGKSVMELKDLQCDVLSYCFSFLSVQDIFTSMRTCKLLKKAAESDVLWKSLCKRDLDLERNSLTPWKDVYQEGAVSP
jgi:hypothetical protein